MLFRSKYNEDGFSVEMPHPRVVTDKLIMKPSYFNYDNLTFKGKVEVGVPHVIYQLDNEMDLEDYNVYDLGEDWNNSKPYTNVNVYQMAKEGIKIRTYERGVWDETMACGSGCCAVAYDVLSDVTNDYTDNKVRLIVKSGEVLTVEHNKDTDTYWLSGPAKKLFTGVI